MSYDVSTYNYYGYEITDINLQDLLINYGDITEVSDSFIFKLKDQKVRVVKRDDETLMTFNFELDYSKTFIEREIYTILDFLSDIGGLNDILIALFTIMLALINSKNSEIFMASRLYKISKPVTDSEIENKSNSEEQSEFFKPT